LFPLRKCACGRYVARKTVILVQNLALHFEFVLTRHAEILGNLQKFLSRGFRTVEDGFEQASPDRVEVHAIARGAPLPVAAARDQLRAVRPLKTCPNNLCR
jgi:hypothetical protein